MTMIADIVHTLLVQGVEFVQGVGRQRLRLGRPLPAPVRHADPVVLIGGFATSPNLWEPWARSLRADGLEVHVVDVPANGLGDMRAAAQSVRDAVEGVRRLTGAHRVDIVGFSEGGILARMFVAMYGGAGAVDSIVSVASPHGGVGYGPLLRLLSHLPLLGPAVPEAALQLSQGSELLRSLESAERAHPGGVRTTSIYTRGFDGVVWPARRGVLQGAVNIGLAGPNHLTIVRNDDAAYELARRALLA